MIRRITLLPALLVFLAPGATGQVNYKVIKVNGSIVYVKSGDAMSQGDVFPENEHLSFRTPASRAAVINPDKGRFILQPDNTKDLAHARTRFLPGMNNISTRAGAINNLGDLRSHFSDSLILVDRMSLTVNPYEFPMDADHFFFLTYAYLGETINKKLGHDGKKMVIDRDSLLMVDGDPIVRPDKPTMTLAYYGPESVKMVSAFSMFFPDRENLNSEISILLDGLRNEPYAAKVSQVSGYLYEFYGKPDKSDVIHYLDEQFGISPGD